jgi:hypothetical protein
MKVSRSCFAPLIMAAALSCAASEFQNLGFDDADLSGLLSTNSSVGWTAKLLPGWTLRQDAIPLDYISLSDTLGAFVPFVYLLDIFFSPIGAGRFTLASGRTSTNDPVFSIEQTGSVPPGAEYLACAVDGFEMEFEVNGQPIAPTNPPGPGPSPFGVSGPTNLIYRVGAYAGKEVQLAFSGPFGPPPAMGVYGAFSYLDSIRFVSAPPQLAVSRSGTNLVVSWPASTFGYVLQSTSSLKPGTWTDLPITPMVSGDQQTASVNLATQAQFYRLGLAAPKSQ